MVSLGGEVPESASRYRGVVAGVVEEMKGERKEGRAATHTAPTLRPVL